MLLPSADTEPFVTVLLAGHVRAVPLGRDYCILLLQTWAANPAVIRHWQVACHRNSIVDRAVEVQCLSLSEEGSLGCRAEADLPFTCGKASKFMPAA